MRDAGQELTEPPAVLRVTFRIVDLELDEEVDDIGLHTEDRGLGMLVEVARSVFVLEETLVELAEDTR